MPAVSRCWRLLICATVGCLLGELSGFDATALVLAASIEPYQARVEAPPGEDVYVRCGPGKKHYYPTMKLPNGSLVTVRRHDAGGWSMIDPPAGSFSWIPGKYVQSNGGPQGIVTENGVVVRVGSFESDVRDVEQKRLNKGDPVEILGEKTFQATKGPELWYKIKSPVGEQRWVQGQYLVPLNADGTPRAITPGTTTARTSSKSAASTEANQPTTPRTTKNVSGPSTGPRTAQPATATTAPRTRPDGGDAPLYGHKPSDSVISKSGVITKSGTPGTDKGSNADEEDPFANLAPGSAVAAGSSGGEPGTAADNEQMTAADWQAELRAIDEELQQMLRLPAAEWDIDSLAENYVALEEATAEDAPFVAAQARNRLKTLDHYHRIQVAAADVARITRETAERDRQLQGLPPISANNPQTQPSRPKPTDSTAAGTPSSASAKRPAGSRFDGAGIVRRLANPQPGMPRHALTTPDGRLLAYLVPEGNIPLDQVVGRAMGLNGPRAFEPQLRADLLRVRTMSPVQLAR